MRKVEQVTELGEKQVLVGPLGELRVGPPFDERFNGRWQPHGVRVAPLFVERGPGCIREYLTRNSVCKDARICRPPCPGEANHT